MNGIELRVKGKVQGVGFRPFVWQLAHRLRLKGEVLNDGQGVLICFAKHGNINVFKQQLVSELPPLAHIDELKIRDIHWDTLPDGFSIIKSKATNIDTQVVPDAATCPECLDELLNNRDRRYHYPFINCTHCGPRFTIIKQLPYDRPKTVMADFPMCQNCSKEYQSPADRRYHAQPVACPHCGPLAQAVLPDGTISSENWFDIAITALAQGKIIAIKSVGGFHLACDATNTKAIQTLRDRKHRQHKPFAIMVSNSKTVHSLAKMNEYEEKTLESSAAPIVLLKRKRPYSLADNVAPHLNEIGIMLPSNPVQHMISNHFKNPVVMTSGNCTGLPPTLENAQAMQELKGIADLFILHNRSIVQRCDDSLVRVDKNGQQETLRRSRGFVPDAITLPNGFPLADGYLAYGGDLKSAFAIGKSNQIIVGQYLGDLANIETQTQYKKAIAHFTALYEIKTIHHIADLHPGYFSHQFAQSQQGSPIFVQHHHAHVASCLVENQWTPDSGKVLALTMDGIGFGGDGTMWGAELLIADYKNYQRIGGIPAIDLVGGDKAAKEPWRSLYAHLKAFYPQINGNLISDVFKRKPISLLERSMEKGINCHSIRSAGRLFDAVAASLGIAFDSSEYEGLPACQLEALAQNCSTQANITPIEIAQHHLELDLTTFWKPFLEYEGSREEKAYLFHLSLASALAKIVTIAQQQHKDINHLVLTGGVFHNALLTQLLKKALNDKITLLLHTKFSCGDGGLALGQMAIALMKEK
ncbi:carbamoyltransferase HypF [Vibrio algarum]|uniref:Carbamoyltransferase HypF n=1 Tax=Vibrio algarum TaxID=3020714 RepID=A0ABT4YMI2_9VIBR|nr:carbamoyltransferase HypF [Vibrio sp. KJ40-1]MDB1122383.1 carbamoyltransferase HypF [Vibrio sp. KJ40-1]